MALIYKDKLITAYLDLGYIITLIDSRLARGLAYLGYTETPITPILVSGISSRHLSASYVSFDIFFVGYH